MISHADADPEKATRLQALALGERTGDAEEKKRKDKRAPKV